MSASNSTKKKSAADIASEIEGLLRRAAQLSARREECARGGNRAEFDRMTREIDQLKSDTDFAESQLRVAKEQEEADRAKEVENHAEQVRAELARRGAEIHRLASIVDMHFAAAAVALREVRENAAAMFHVSKRDVLRRFSQKTPFTCAAGFHGLEDFLDMEHTRGSHRQPLAKATDFLRGDQ